MATPMSACFSAAASLTASPVIATTSPDCCMSLARRSLSSGATRPNTCSWGSRSITSASVRCCSSVPVITPGPRPSSSAIARAVMVWSPVIIRTSIPAASAVWTASLASVRSGSTIPTSATKTRSVTAAIGSASAADIAASSMSLAANASTRSPRSDSLRLAARISSRTVPIGTCWPCHRARSQRSRTTSGAPLTVTRCGCCDDRAGQPVRAVVEGGHELVLGVERHLGPAGQGFAGLLGVHAHLRGQHHERRLGRVADDRPVVADGGVGAQHQAQGQVAEVRRLRPGHAQDRAGLGVAGAFDLEPVTAAQHGGRGHRVHRQRAGLVGVDDGGPAQGLHVASAT